MERKSRKHHLELQPNSLHSRPAPLSLQPNPQPLRQRDAVADDDQRHCARYLSRFRCCGARRSQTVRKALAHNGSRGGPCWSRASHLPHQSCQPSCGSWQGGARSSDELCRGRFAGAVPTSSSSLGIVVRPKVPCVGGGPASGAVPTASDSNLKCSCCSRCRAYAASSGGQLSASASGTMVDVHTSTWQAAARASALRRHSSAPEPESGHAACTAAARSVVNATWKSCCANQQLGSVRRWAGSGSQDRRSSEAATWSALGSTRWTGVPCTSGGSMMRLHRCRRSSAWALRPSPAAPGSTAPPRPGESSCGSDCQSSSLRPTTCEELAGRRGAVSVADGSLPPHTRSLSIRVVWSSMARSLSSASMRAAGSSTEAGAAAAAIWESAKGDLSANRRASTRMLVLVSGLRSSVLSSTDREPRSSSKVSGITERDSMSEELSCSLATSALRSPVSRASTSASTISSHSAHPKPRCTCSLPHSHTPAEPACARTLPTSRTPFKIWSASTVSPP